MTGFKSKKTAALDEEGMYLVHQTAQPVQEPVAYYHPHKGFYWAKPTHISAPTAVDVPPVPLYVKWQAAQRPWVDLTDEEIDQGLLHSNHALQTAGAWRDGVDWATKQLKEKNK